MFERLQELVELPLAGHPEFDLYHDLIRWRGERDQLRGIGRRRRVDDDNARGRAKLLESP